MKFLLLLTLLLLPVSFNAHAENSDSKNDTETTKPLHEFEVFINNNDFDFNTSRFFKDELLAFYKDREFKPVWFDKENNPIE